MIIIYLFLIVMLIFLIVYSVNKSSKNSSQEKFNEGVVDSLKNSNFVYNKIFYISDEASFNRNNLCKKLILADTKSKKMCLIDYEKFNAVVVNFDEILNYEIYENGATQTTGGKLGYFASVFTAETKNKCKELKLIIRVKSYETPQISYSIIDNTFLNSGESKSSALFKECIDSLQQVVSFLEVIVKENENNKKLNNPANSAGENSTEE